MGRCCVVAAGCLAIVCRACRGLARPKEVREPGTVRKEECVWNAGMPGTVVAAAPWVGGAWGGATADICGRMLACFG